MSSNKPIFKSFLLGTTLCLSIFPFVYLGTPHIKYGPLEGIKFEHIIIFLPLYFGFVNALMVHFMPKITKYSSHSIQNTFITGALCGLFMSYIGRFWYNIPEQLFKDLENKSLVHLYAMVLYSLVFSIVARNFNLYFECK